MGGYIRGVVLNGIIVGFLTSLGLLLLGIDFALVLGALAGVLELSGSLADCRRCDHCRAEHASVTDQSTGGAVHDRHAAT